MTDCPHATVLHSMRPDRDGVPKNHWACEFCDFEFWPMERHRNAAEPFQSECERAAHAALGLYSRRCDRYVKLHPDIAVEPDSLEAQNVRIEILIESIQHVFAPLIAEEVQIALGLEDPKRVPLEPRPDDPTKAPEDYRRDYVKGGDYVWRRQWVHKPDDGTQP